MFGYCYTWILSPLSVTVERTGEFDKLWKQCGLAVGSGLKNGGHRSPSSLQKYA